jgi:hypothetical protein
MLGMSRFGKLALFVPLLVLLFGFVIFGLVAEFAYLAMLWATIGGLIVTDWWKWTGVVLLTLPVLARVSAGVEPQAKTLVAPIGCCNRTPSQLRTRSLFRAFCFLPFALLRPLAVGLRPDSIHILSSFFAFPPRIASLSASLMGSPRIASSISGMLPI